MAKEAYYFKHDLYSRNDPNLVELKRVHGSQGKGIYWDIVEMLHEQGGKMNYDIKSLAYDLREDEKIVESIINNFKLFRKNKKQFWSDRVVKNLEDRNKISKAAKGAASKRWGADANALPTHSERNAIKGDKIKGDEKKEEYRKGDEIKPPALPPIEIPFTPEPEKKEPPPFAAEPPPIGFMWVADCKDKYFTDEYFSITREQLCFSRYCDVPTLKDWGGAFNRFLISTGQNAKTMQDWASHFGNWLKKQNMDLNPTKLHTEYESTNSKTGTANGNTKGGTVQDAFDAIDRMPD